MSFFVCISLITGEIRFLGHLRSLSCCSGGAHLPICARSWSCRGPGHQHTLPPGTSRSSDTACTVGSRSLRRKREERRNCYSSEPSFMPQYQDQVSWPCALRFALHILPTSHLSAPALGLGQQYFRSISKPIFYLQPLS